MRRRPPALPAAALAATAALATLLAAGRAGATDRFVTPGGTGSACLQTSPCALPTALAAAIAGDRVIVAAGTYTGSGSQVAQLGRSIELLGGWDGAATGAVVRNPSAHLSVLDGGNARRGLTITDSTPVVDGFTITRGNAGGLLAGCPDGDGPAAGCGGGVLVWRAAPQLTRLTITGNVAASSARPGTTAYGGGIAASEAAGMLIADSLIAGNVAAAGGRGVGGGAALQRADGARVERSRIVANTAAATAGAAGRGGGLWAHDGMGTILEGDVVSDNAAAPTGSAEGNQMLVARAQVFLLASCIRGDRAPDALVVAEGSAVLERTTVLHAASGWAVTASTADAGPFQATHCVFAGGSEGVLRFLGGEQIPTLAVLEHATIVGSGNGTGVLASGFATVQIANSIVAGNAVGVAPGVPPFTVVIPDTTLYWNNVADGTRGDHAVDGDPAFVNAPAGDYHIGPGSAAIGRADDRGVDVDIDGDVRPGLGGYDIGADELTVRRFDFGTVTSPAAAGYAPVTPATAYAAAAGFGWTAGVLDARDRRSNGDLLRDFVFAPLATFAVDVPAARHRVSVTLGDAAAAHGQMGVFLEGAQVAAVTTAANEFRTVTADVAVTDGQLTVLLDDLGGADVNVVVNALTVEPALPARFDLGTAASPVADGYARLTHASPYSLAAGAGWLGGTVASRDRGSADPLRRDFAFTPRGVLGFHLGNGLYDVTVLQGDATGAHDLMETAVQGRTLPPATTAVNQYAVRACRTCAADATLHVALVDRGGKDPNAVVNAVEITAARAPRFDFGTATSPAAAGYTQVTHTTLYAAGLGYGWQSGTVGSRDRATGSDLDRDLNLTTDATFAADVLNGRYRVSVSLGDFAAAHDGMGVTIEGVLVDTVSTAKGQIVTRAFTAVVADGQLTLRLQDLAGPDPNAVITALEIR